MSNFYSDCICECSFPDCPWVLLRNPGHGYYYFIVNTKSCYSFMQIHFAVSHNYFKCRSIAIKMYKSFVESLKE